MRYQAVMHETSNDWLRQRAFPRHLQTTLLSYIATAPVNNTFPNSYMFLLTPVGPLSTRGRNIKHQSSPTNKHQQPTHTTSSQDFQPGRQNVIHKSDPEVNDQSKRASETPRSRVMALGQTNPKEQQDLLAEHPLTSVISITIF